MAGKKNINRCTNRASCFCVNVFYTVPDLRNYWRAVRRQYAYRFHEISHESFQICQSSPVNVAAKRWENSGNGRSGYVPACINELSHACPKTGGGRMKCGDCPNRNFIRLSADVMEKHLKGQLTIGVYPMFPDETCRFLAFDLKNVCILRYSRLKSSFGDTALYDSE